MVYAFLENLTNSDNQGFHRIFKSKSVVGPLKRNV